MPVLRKKILFVEDDLTTIEIYKEIFKKAKFDFEIFKSGKEFLKVLDEIRQKKRKKPNLVVLDLILPDISGIEILKIIQKEKGLRDIPFFVLTNYTDPYLEKEIQEFDIKKYIIKTDHTPGQLVKLIENWFKKA